MRRRIYWLLPDLASAIRMENDLLLARVAWQHIHFVGREDADMTGLHAANVLQSSDLIRSAQTGLVIGAGLGTILGVVAALFFPIVGDAPEWGMAAVLAILGGLFGAWASSMIGISTPSSRLKRFAPAFNSASTASVEIYANLGYKWFNLRYGRFVSDFFGWNVNNSGVGVFNSLQPQAGLTGSSKGSQNLELSCTFEVAEGTTLKGTAGRQTIPNSVGLSWTYYSLAATKSLADNWSAGLLLSGTSRPAGFKQYGSLTNNGQTSTPSRSTLVVSLSKGF